LKVFSIGHYSRENYVAIQFSLFQRGKNQMVVFVFFYIKFKWPPNYPLLKEKNLLRKSRIRLATQISLLLLNYKGPLGVHQVFCFPRPKTTKWPPSGFFFFFGLETIWWPLSGFNPRLQRTT
jgi:hypothetical protein